MIEVIIVAKICLAILFFITTSQELFNTNLRKTILIANFIFSLLFLSIPADYITNLWGISLTINMLNVLALVFFDFAILVLASDEKDSSFAAVLGVLCFFLLSLNSTVNQIAIILIIISSLKITKLSEGIFIFLGIVAFYVSTILQNYLMMKYASSFLLFLIFFSLYSHLNTVAKDNTILSLEKLFFAFCLFVSIGVELLIAPIFIQVLILAGILLIETYRLLSSTLHEPRIKRNNSRVITLGISLLIITSLNISHGMSFLWALLIISNIPVIYLIQAISNQSFIDQEKFIWIKKYLLPTGLYFVSLAPLSVFFFFSHHLILKLFTEGSIFIGISLLILLIINSAQSLKEVLLIHKDNKLAQTQNICINETKPLTIYALIIALISIIIVNLTLGFMLLPEVFVGPEGQFLLNFLGNKENYIKDDISLRFQYSFFTLYLLLLSALSALSIYVVVSNKNSKIPSSLYKIVNKFECLQNINEVLTLFLKNTLSLINVAIFSMYKIGLHLKNILQDSTALLFYKRDQSELTSPYILTFILAITLLIGSIVFLAGGVR